MKQTKAPLVAPSPPSKKKESVAKGSDPGAIFMAMVLDMSWKLLIVFLVPVLLGNYLDSRLKESYLFLLIGFGVGLILSILVIFDVYKKASVIQYKGGHKK